MKTTTRKYVRILDTQLISFNDIETIENEVNIEVNSSF